MQMRHARPTNMSACECMYRYDSNVITYKTHEAVIPLPYMVFGCN